MRDDVSAALKEFGVKTFGSGKALERLAAELRPDESVKYIAPSNVVVADRESGKKQVFPGVLFISDARTVISSVASKGVRYEFTHDLLRSVHSEGNGMAPGKVTLATEDRRIDFNCSYKKSVYQKVETLLNDLAAEALREIKEKDANRNERTVAPPVPGTDYALVDHAIIRCDGCGARYIIAREYIRVCEYCRLPLGA